MPRRCSARGTTSRLSVLYNARSTGTINPATALVVGASLPWWLSPLHAAALP